MKLYATITKANGKSEGLGDNEDLVVNLYYKNKVQYTIRISYENVGDIENPTMDTLITTRDWRIETPKGEQQKGEVCEHCGGSISPTDIGCYCKHCGKLLINRI